MQGHSLDRHLDCRQDHKQVHRAAAGKVNLSDLPWCRSILPQLEFDRSDQGRTEPKK